MSYLEYQLLIAMPGLDDPNFNRSVTLLCQHNADGALGININRVSEFTVLEVLQQLGASCEESEIASRPVFDGGPVSRDRGFVVHSPEQSWASTARISSDLSLTTSRDVLEAIAEGKGPEHYLLALGYAGWGAGQLEQELKESSWLTAPVSPFIVFDAPPEKRWELAVSQLGIDAGSLHSVGGQA